MPDWGGGKGLPVHVVEKDQSPVRALQMVDELGAKKERDLHQQIQ